MTKLLILHDCRLLTHRSKGIKKFEVVKYVTTEYTVSNLVGVQLGCLNHNVNEKTKFVTRTKEKAIKSLTQTRRRRRREKWPAVVLAETNRVDVASPLSAARVLLNGQLYK